MSPKKSFNGSGSKQIHLTVRLADKDDGPKMFRFYRNNPHPDVDLRKPEIIKERAAAGQAILFETPEGDIKFSSITYEYSKPGESETTWCENGSTQATVSGLGAYPFVMASQVLLGFLDKTPKDKFLGSFSSDSPNIEKMIIGRSKWVKFKPSDECLAATKATKEVDPDQSERTWVELPTFRIPHQARTILKYLEKNEAGKLERRKRGNPTGEKIVLDTSDFPLANKLRPALTELANGAFGKYLESQPHLGYAVARKQLEKHMNGPGFKGDSPSL